MRVWPLRDTAARVDVTAYAESIHYAALGLILVVGAYLRLTALDRQSLWFDEIDVVVRAQRPLGAVLHTFVAAGENGPFYNILLALWIRLAGISETAVRLPSAVAGVLAIPLIYLVARRLAGSTVGLVAAGLLAISPYHVWYSQEAKMYSIVLLLALASSYALIEALTTNYARWWVAYTAATTLLFYTHVATVLVFAAQCLYVLATYRTWRGRARGWLISVGLLTLPYVPIALWALKVIGGQVPTWQPKVRLWDALQIFAIKFAINRYDMTTQIRAALLYATLAGLGVLVLALRRRPQRWWLLLLVLTVVPVFGLWIVSLRQSVFADRYAIVALPAYLILVAAAVVRLARSRLFWPLGLVALVLLLTYAWEPLRDVNRTQSEQKEDWRRAYGWVSARALPGDVLLIDPGYMLSTYSYFVQRDPELAQQKPLPIPTVGGTVDQAALLRLIHEQSDGSTRLWLIESPDRVGGEDPQAVLKRWLDAHGTTSNLLTANGVYVVLYQLEQPV